MTENVEDDPSAAYQQALEHYEEVKAAKSSPDAVSKAYDAVVETHAQLVAEAERPILDDLRKAKVRSKSLSAFDANKNPAALHILLDHLERGGYPDIVTWELGNLLATRAMASSWDRLRAIYLSPRSDAEEEAAAIALRGCATKERYDDMVALATDPSLGPYRSIFLNPIVRFGREDGWRVVESVQHDPALHQEASEMLERRERRRRT